MQTKGAIDFSNQTSNQKAADQSTINKLLNDVFAVNQLKTAPKTEPEQKDSDPDDSSKSNEPESEEQKQQNAAEEGHKDFLKEDSKEQEKNVQKLEALTKVAEFVLFRTKSINPIDLFPDEIIVDTNKVTVIHRTFFESERIHSIMFKDVSDVFVDTGLLFARLSIVDSGFVENEVAVEFLSKDAATKARRIIQGLVVAQNQAIDFAKLQQELSDEQIIEKIETLGRARIGN